MVKQISQLKSANTNLEQKLEELEQELAKDKVKEIIVFLGNPGVGKSTLCNSIFQKKVFESEVSIGRGMNRKKQEYIYANRKYYIDTPGLSNVEQT